MSPRTAAESATWLVKPARTPPSPALPYFYTLFTYSAGQLSVCCLHNASGGAASAATAFSSFEKRRRMSNGFSQRFKIHRIFATVSRLTGHIESVESFDATCCLCHRRARFEPAAGLVDDGKISKVTCQSCEQVGSLPRSELGTLLDDQHRRDLLLLINRV